MAKRERRTFTEDFNEQIVKLYDSGKPRKNIMLEYDLTPTAFNNMDQKIKPLGPLVRRIIAYLNLTC